MIFLPMYFVCAMTGECAFMPVSEAVSSELECEAILEAKDAYLNNNPAVRRFKSVCIQIDNAVIIQKKGTV